MTTTHTLRAITDTDDDFLWRLNEETLRDHIEQIWGWDEETQRAHFQERLRRESEKQLILIDDERVGYLELSERDETLHIINIQISSHHQGKGLGDQVMRDLLKRASSRGCGVELGVFKVNTRALKFYERLDFHIVGSSETHWEMRWTSDRRI